ncbi:MAG: hypothetical protein P4L46_05105 [Fimbriimonas sp.]|nr:hypothetical protein [Fimbriimonas sp.]
MRLRLPIVLPFVLLLAGCQTPSLPNPNDPNDVGPLSADNIRAQLSSMSDSLQMHVFRNEITDDQYHQLMQRAAEKLLKGYSADRLDPTNAWKYGEVLITAHMWPEAKDALQAAVDTAKASHNEDRRVNDTLRLARVLAEMGQVETAIKTARSVFDVRPQDGAPILYAVSNEIVKSAQGKGRDLELAKLLEDAIAIHWRVQVDRSSNVGKAFLFARPLQVRRAWKTVAELYTKANRPDLAERAMAKIRPTSRTSLSSQSWVRV